MPGRVRYLVNKFLAVCKVYLIANHMCMYKFTVNKTTSCSSGEELSSLMYNLRVLFAFANHLKCDKCPESHITKSSSQISDFIAFEISSRYC